MTGLHIVVTLLVGACIGYITNYIAVKMLFRPYNPVKIGSKTLPLTPGVIPKNRGRIAKAIGNAVEGNLFSMDDIMGKLDADALAEKAAGSINLDVKVEELVDAETRGKVCSVLTDMVAEKIKEIDIKALAMDKFARPIQEQFAGTMVAMFINESTIGTFVEPVAQKIYTDMDGDGKGLIEGLISEELVKISEMSVREGLEKFEIDGQGVIRKVIADFLTNNAGGLIPEIDIAGTIEEKVNAMDVKEFEKLVLSVMKKELNAVVNLGALIGLIIGAINLIF